MITFNLAETLLFNIGIGVFSGIITLATLYCYKKNFADTYDVRLLRKIGIAILLILSTDIGMWVLNGKSGQLIRVLSYADNVLYFLLQIVVALVWLRYAHYRIFGRKMARKKEVFLVLIPFAVLSLLVASSPVSGWCFYLDGANYYHRGILSVPMSVFILIYLLSVSVMALTQYKKEVFSDRRKELITLAFFVIPPFLGGIVQTVSYGLSTIWPCAVISSLLVLLNKESQLMAQDSITGLNNRRSMERYLMAYEEGQNRGVTVIMVDINDFKHINDRYGHSSGDVALVQAANILRAAFNGTAAFLARYGGDEFVIVMSQGEEKAARETVQKIKGGFDVFNQKGQFPFQLSVSAGYALSTEKTGSRMAGLFKEADANMYRDKALYHRVAEAER